MSDRAYENVIDQLRAFRKVTAEMGCALPEALLQLAFLPLPVIPHLKLTDKGLVDVDKFQLIAA
jgi:adenine deaminase